MCFVYVFGWPAAGADSKGKVEQQREERGGTFPLRMGLGCVVWLSLIVVFYSNMSWIRKRVILLIY